MLRLKEVLLVLNPFEVTGGDATGIGEDVGDHGDAALGELIAGVGAGGRRARDSVGAEGELPRR